MLFRNERVHLSYAVKNRIVNRRRETERLVQDYCHNSLHVYYNSGETYPQ